MHYIWLLCLFRLLFIYLSPFPLDLDLLRGEQITYLITLSFTLCPLLLGPGGTPLVTF